MQSLVPLAESLFEIYKDCWLFIEDNYIFVTLGSPQNQSTIQSEDEQKYNKTVEFTKELFALDKYITYCNCSGYGKEVIQNLLHHAAFFFIYLSASSSSDYLRHKGRHLAILTILVLALLVLTLKLSFKVSPMYSRWVAVPVSKLLLTKNIRIGKLEPDQTVPCLQTSYSYSMNTLGRFLHAA